MTKKTMGETFAALEALVAEGLAEMDEHGALRQTTLGACVLALEEADLGPAQKVAEVLRPILAPKPQRAPKHHRISRRPANPVDGDTWQRGGEGPTWRYDGGEWLPPRVGNHNDGEKDATEVSSEPERRASLCRKLEALATAAGLTAEDVQRKLVARFGYKKPPRPEDPAVPLEHLEQLLTALERQAREA